METSLRRVTNLTGKLWARINLVKMATWIARRRVAMGKKQSTSSDIEEARCLAWSRMSKKPNELKLSSHDGE